MTTSRRPKVSRPLWQRIRHLLRTVADGLPPQRAAVLAGVNLDANNQRLAALINRAEAIAIKRWVATIDAAGADRLHREYQWEHVTSTDTPDESPAAASVGVANPPTRARAWTKPGDWKAHLALLERRFPREYGAQVAPDVGSQVAEVIKAMAELRASVAGQPPQGLPTTLIARPQLPATEDAPAHAREGNAREGETGVPG